MQGGGGGLLLLLLLLLLAGELALCTPEGTDCTLYKGIQGEDFTLPPNVSGTLTEIIWKKKVDMKFNKVAEWEDGTSNFFSQLQNRAEIDPGSGNLTIRNISQKIDGGTYEAEALVGGSYRHTYVCLEILEPPSTPNLTCSIDDDGIHVNCMLVTHYDLSVSYRWDYINMNDISQSNSTKELSSIKLPKNTASSENITCTVVASRTSVNNSISLMTCNSRGSPPQERVRTITGILFGALIVGLAICGLVIWWKRKDVPKRQPDETVPFRDEDPENVIVQTIRREEVPQDNESMPSHGLMSEPENKKISSSEEDPEVHTDESKPSHGLTSEAENKKTSNCEDETTAES